MRDLRLCTSQPHQIADVGEVRKRFHDIIRKEGTPMLCSSMCRRLLIAALAVGSLGLAGPGRAAAPYPTRAIMLVVPFTPATPTDFAARRLGQALSGILHRSVIVDNRAGAGGIIGSTYVSKATPDGNTPLAGTQSTHAINVGLYKTLAYDPIKDFTPISRISAAP